MGEFNQSIKINGQFNFILGFKKDKKARSLTLVCRICRNDIEEFYMVSLSFLSCIAKIYNVNKSITFAIGTVEVLMLRGFVGGKVYPIETWYNNIKRLTWLH